MDTLRCDLVLEGGGVKGIALVGALSVLEEAGYAFERVAGTSAGAIVGALTAAGMPTEEQAELIRTVDYRRFQDAGREDRVPLLGKVWSLVHSQGVYEGEYLKAWLAEQLAARGVRTFADLRVPGTGDDLPTQRRYRLVVTASDITHGRLRFLPWDCDRFGQQADDVPVADAVRASMSIPFFYEPVKLRDGDGDEVWLVDGGMLSNFPVAVFDRTDGQRPRWPTFGIKLSARGRTSAPRHRVHDLPSFARALVGTMTGFHDQMHLDDPGVLARTIFVDTTGVQATDFDLDRATAARLYDAGRRAAERFLDRWDWEAYLREHRGVPAAEVPAQEAPAASAQAPSAPPTRV